MAVFNKNEELSRQQQRIAPDQATGLRKVALGALGYKATGEQSNFGKVLGYIPGGQTARHFMARGVAGKANKSDYAATLKAGDKDAVNKLAQDVKLGVEVAKVVGTGGAAGGVGGAAGASSAGGGIANSSMEAGVPSMSTGGISGGLSGEDALKQFQESGGDMESLDKFNQVKESQKGNKLVEGKDLLDKSIEASESNLQTDPTEGSKYDKAINTTETIGDLGSNVPVAGGIIEAAAGSATAGMSYNAALSEKNKEFQNKKKALSDDSLWM